MRRPRFRPPAIRLFAGLLLAATALGAQAMNREPHSIEVGGQMRDYIVVTPDRPASGPMPLVLLLHGHFGTAGNTLGDGRLPSPLAAWTRIVDREQIVVAALQGLDGRDGHSGWRDCRADATGTPQSGDVAYADAVVADLVGSGKVDPRRLYVMGMSNGAMMSFRLAAEMQPAPAAIAAVSGTMAARSECAQPKNKVSVLIIQGTADPIVPFLGGATGGSGRNTGTVTGAAASRDWWLRFNGLAGTPAIDSSYPHNPSSGATSASRQTWGADAGPQVAMITVSGGGHVEPSLRYTIGWLYGKLVGAQNHDFESAEEAWAFFKPKSAP